MMDSQMVKSERRDVCATGVEKFIFDLGLVDL